MREFLEFIIIEGFLFVLASLIFTAVMYYVENLSLEESIGLGLGMGILFRAMSIASNRTDYQLIVIGIVLGIMAFLLKFVFEYYVYNQPLKDSIRWGSIVGIVFTILFPIFMKSIDFLFDLIYYLTGYK